MGLEPMCEKVIFCVFCDDKFFKKSDAADHLRGHLIQSVKSSILDTVHTDWIKEYINSCSTQTPGSASRDNWKHCPVCEKLSPVTKKEQRKKSVLKDHIRSHLCYKQFMCKLCTGSRDLPPTRFKVMLNDKGTRGLYTVTKRVINKTFTSRKSSKKALTKHIREDHLDMGNPQIREFSKSERNLTINDLIQVCRIEAIEELLDKIKLDPKSSEKEVFITDDNEVLCTIITQPLQSSTVLNDSNSILAPQTIKKDYLSPRSKNKRRRTTSATRKNSMSEPKIQKKKLVSSTVAKSAIANIDEFYNYPYNELDLDIDIESDVEKDSLLSSSSLSGSEDSLNATSITSQTPIHYDCRLSAEHNYCKTPLQLKPYLLSSLSVGYESCESTSSEKLEASQRSDDSSTDCGYSSDVNDEQDILEGALDLFKDKDLSRKMCDYTSTGVLFNELRTFGDYFYDIDMETCAQKCDNIVVENLYKHLLNNYDSAPDSDPRRRILPHISCKDIDSLFNFNRINC